MKEPAIPVPWMSIHRRQRRRRAIQPVAPRPNATQAMRNRCQSWRHRSPARTVAVLNTTAKFQKYTVPARGWRPGRLPAGSAGGPPAHELGVGEALKARGAEDTRAAVGNER